MSDRAKQFQPFDALKGYKEELRKRERITVLKKELTLDEEEELNNIIYKLEKNMMIKLIYYDTSEYIEVTGVITKIDLNEKYIKVVNKKIDFMEIKSISIIE